MTSKVSNGVTANTEIGRVPRLEKTDWDDFRIFAAVARVGSFARAAAELGIRQPTVSRRIARLERIIGAKLFDRTPRGRELTFEGTRVLSEASAAELALQRALERGKAAAKKIHADCKLVVGDGVGCYWLPQFIPPFQRSNPGIALKVFTTNTPAQSQRTTFDLQIQYAPPQEADTVAVRLGVMHLMLFASPEYLRANGTPKRFEDLTSHSLIDLTLYLTDKGTWSSQGSS